MASKSEASAKRKLPPPEHQSTPDCTPIRTTEHRDSLYGFNDLDSPPPSPSSAALSPVTNSCLSTPNKSPLRKKAEKRTLKYKKLTESTNIPVYRPAALKRRPPRKKAKPQVITVTYTRTHTHTHTHTHTQSHTILGFV